MQREVHWTCIWCPATQAEDNIEGMLEHLHSHDVLWELQNEMDNAGDRPMHEFSTDTFSEVRGRGTVAEIETDQIPEGIWEPNDLQGQTVLINGNECRVRGVVTYAIHRSTNHPYRKSFGLLVDSSGDVAQR